MGAAVNGDDLARDWAALLACERDHLGGTSLFTTKDGTSLLRAADSEIASAVAAATTAELTSDTLEKAEQAMAAIFERVQTETGLTRADIRLIGAGTDARKLAAIDQNEVPEILACGSNYIPPTTESRVLYEAPGLALVLDMVTHRLGTVPTFTAYFLGSLVNSTPQGSDFTKSWPLAPLNAELLRLYFELREARLLNIDFQNDSANLVPSHGDVTDFHRKLETMAAKALFDLETRTFKIAGVLPSEVITHESGLATCYSARLVATPHSIVLNSIRDHDLIVRTFPRDTCGSIFEIAQGCQSSQVRVTALERAIQYFKLAHRAKMGGLIKAESL